MRKVFSDIVEKGRVLTGNWSSAHGSRMGAFRIPSPFGPTSFGVIISDGSDWDLLVLPPPAFEHVSVSLPDRCPRWPEMVFIKDLFFEEEEQVIQYHPPKSQHINCHEFCLHMWKPIGVIFPSPPKITVGPAPTSINMEKK